MDTRYFKRATYTVQRRKCEDLGTKLSHKLLTSFIPLSPHYYAHCPDMVQHVDISFSRVQIVTTDKGNPRGLTAIAFVMISCPSDESKSLSNYSGEEFPKNISESFILGPIHQLSVYKPLQVSSSFFKSSHTHEETEVVCLWSQCGSFPLASLMENSFSWIWRNHPLEW